MKFTVEELKTCGSLQEEGELETETLLGKPPEFVRYRSPVSIQAEATYLGRQVSLEISFQTKFEFTCGRCLETFEAPVDDKIKQVISIDKSFIDIDYNIKEALLLSLPLNAVCQDNCQGLCPVCGVNKNKKSCRCRRESGSEKWAGLNKIKFS